jgi:tetratricopeptide (TPR) repeat protein
MNSQLSKFGNYSLMLYFFFFLTYCSCSSPTKEVSTQPNLEIPRQHYSRGNLQKAIEGYSRALEKYPDEPIVLETYSQVLEEIKQSADNAFQSEDFALAEQRYSLLLRNFPRFQTFERMLSFDPKYLGHRIKECLIARSQAQIQHTINAGEYVNTIEVYKSVIKAYPEDISLRKNLIEEVKELHRRGEKALEEEEYAAAGKLYAFLLNENQWLINLDMPLPFSSESLGEGLKQCRIQLTRKGLELYRKEKLKEAISVWKSILEFDPENAEIRKAIGNAEEQLKKIKK